MNPYNVSIPLLDPEMAMNAGRVIGLNHVLQIGACLDDSNNFDERANKASEHCKQKARELAVESGLFESVVAATDVSLITAFNARSQHPDREANIQWWCTWAPIMSLLEASAMLNDLHEKYKGQDMVQVDPIDSIVSFLASRINVIPDGYPASMFLGGAQISTPPMFVEQGDARIPRNGLIVPDATRIFIAANADLTEGEELDDEPYVRGGDGRECLALLEGRKPEELVKVGRLAMAYDILQLYGSFSQRHSERDVVANVFVNVVQMQQRLAEKLESAGIRLNYDAPNTPPAGADEVTCFNIGQHDFLVTEMRLIKKAKEDNRMVSTAMKFHERLSNEINAMLESLKDAREFPLQVWSLGHRQLRRPLEETHAHVVGGALVKGKPVPVLVRTHVRKTRSEGPVRDVMAEAGLAR